MKSLLSDRVLNLAESETLAMSRRSRELREKGIDVINLSLGEPDFDTPDFIKDAAKLAIDENFTHYTPVAAYPELRQAIADKFLRDNNLNYRAEQIVVSTGAKQSISNVVMSLINEGDEVILPAPYWVSYREIVGLAGGKVIEIPSDISVDFKIDLEKLEAAITPKTKLIIFSSPCNPSGTVLGYKELRAFADIIKKHPNIYVISDEIYEYISYAGKHQSLAQFDEIFDQVITVNGVSKGFAMTGWRVGYIAAPLEIAKATEKIQGQCTSGTCSIAQKAAQAAVESDPSAIQDMIDTFLSRRDLILKLLNEIEGIKLNVPQGAFYVFPDVSFYFGYSNENVVINNDVDFCNYILEEANVAIVPGSAFGIPSCVRISYATSDTQIAEAVNRIKNALSKLTKS